MTETLANGFSSERAQRELLLWTKVASALEGLRRVALPVVASASVAVVGPG